MSPRRSSAKVKKRAAKIARQLADALDAQRRQYGENWPEATRRFRTMIEQEMKDGRLSDPMAAAGRVSIKLGEACADHPILLAVAVEMATGKTV